MTENTEIILRPKVRFSQMFDNVQNKEEAIVRINGPKIRNIVSLEKPVKIVELKKSNSIYNKDTTLNNCNIEGSIHCSNTASKNIKKISLSDNCVPKVETAKILHNTNNFENIRKTSLLQSESLQNDSTKSCKKNFQQKGKENKDAISKKMLSNKNISNRRIGNSQHIQLVANEKFKLSSSNNDIQEINTNIKNLKLIKSQSLPNITKKTTDHITKKRIHNIKFVASNVPRYNTLIRNKVSTVKKTMLRNVTDPKIKTFVESGISYKKQNYVKADDANKKYVTALDITIGELAQPEYNSVTCTISKLKELKQQKIVTDINNLSSVQKNIVNGKISMALDFPLDEVIYKNLVDLSIDEKHLSSAIIRNKDPEPRQKDVMPSLDNFFMPNDIKEIYEAMHVKPRTLKIDENWNAFKISDKLLEWKHCMDNVE